jgi:hypothetical protein
MPRPRPPPNITPELMPKWLALRHQHTQQVAEFERRVKADHAEFERRVEASRQTLLTRHLLEESQLHTSHAQTPGPKRGATVSNSASMPPPASSRATATPSARPGTPEVRQPRKLPVTPSRLPQPSGVPPAPGKPTDRAAVVVIDLCSDDEDDLPLSRRRSKPATQQPIAQDPGSDAPATHKEPMAEEVDDCMIVDQESSMPEAVQNGNPAFSIPSASLSLFGSFSKKRAVCAPALIRLGTY